MWCWSRVVGQGSGWRRRIRSPVAATASTPLCAIQPVALTCAMQWPASPSMSMSSPSMSPTSTLFIKSSTTSWPGRAASTSS